MEIAISNKFKYLGLILPIFLALFLMGQGCAAPAVENQDVQDKSPIAAPVDNDDKEDVMAIEKEEMEDKEVMDEMPMPEPKSEAMRPGSFEDYAASKLSYAADGKVVLFFHASWCPTCRVAENNIVSNKEDIPKGLAILKVDYDSSKDLRKKYGVTYQHTFVQVDASGNLITKWGNSRNIDQIVDKLK